MQIPFISPRAWIKSLKYSVTVKWRPWTIQDKVPGYITSYVNKMTFATVKGSGHTLGYKPEESSILFKRNGYGTFTKVKFAENTASGESVAMKTVDRSSIIKRKVVDQVRNGRSEAEPRKYLEKLIDGVHYCHGNGVYHSALKVIPCLAENQQTF
ncbi:unnamed protein product [Microthlaspi erraticum]|uniref:Protein kinase domain-containing protein n=1 Tax=Microthlaspi erraticum TaxID=1685480 RepID=A0A6D2L4K5_9BRAS|nr:unnamed protein product [Microthlaspi erraticum]